MTLSPHYRPCFFNLSFHTAHFLSLTFPYFLFRILSTLPDDLPLYLTASLPSESFHFSCRKETAFPRVMFIFIWKKTFSSRANGYAAPSYNQDEQPCQISTPKVIYRSSEQTHTACRLLWITSWSASLHGPNTFLHVTVKYADKWIKTRRIGIRTEGKQSCRWVNFSHTQPTQPTGYTDPVHLWREETRREKTNYSWLISAVCTKEDKDLKAADETYRLIALKIMNAAMRNGVKTEGGSAWDRKLHSALWCTLCFKNVYHPSLSVILTARFQ